MPDAIATTAPLVINPSPYQGYHLDLGELPPLPNTRAQENERLIRQTLIRNIKETLTQMLDGFDENPARCLRLLSTYAEQQRSVMALIAAPENDRGSDMSLPGAFAVPSVLGELQPFMQGLLDVLKESNALKYAPKPPPHKRSRKKVKS